MKAHHDQAMKPIKKEEFGKLHIGKTQAMMKISLNSEMNQPNGKGVRITAFVANQRITLDLGYDNFMEAMSGNFHVDAFCEIQNISR
jgi:hypothetical protein